MLIGRVAATLCSVQTVRDHVPFDNGVAARVRTRTRKVNGCPRRDIDAQIASILTLATRRRGGGADGR